MAFLYIAVLFSSLPAVIVFGVLFAISRSRACLVASVLWILPPAYEYLVQLNCTGECNIRVDLLFLIPAQILVLSLASVTALRQYLRSRKSRNGGGGRGGS